MNVIKLGGSLLEAEKMLVCLNHILEFNEKIVVVCGGGIFADTVRAAQKKWHFDDVVAHKMAVLAMQQTAMMLQNLHPKFTLESTISNLKNHRFSIWLPDIFDLNAAQVSPSWEMTSDSLAAWLATKLEAEKLIVVKSCDVDSTLNVDELTAKGIVDGEFANFVNGAKFDLNILSVNTFLNL